MLTFKCPKCGNEHEERFTIKYIQEKKPNSNDEDHLIIRCERCQYTWQAPCADQIKLSIENGIKELLQDFDQYSKLTGFWSGYEIKITTSDKTYVLKTQNGVRGINVPVNIFIEEKMIYVKDMQNNHIPLLEI